MLWLMSFLFAGLTAWTCLQTQLTFRADIITDVRIGDVFRRVPARLILMISLITGIEASAGGWLTTYAAREGHHLGAIVAAPSCFWAGLVCSRTVWSVRNAAFAERTLVRASLVLMAAASSVLFAASTSTLALLASACLLGFGIGPVYPLLLSWALPFHRGGPIFFLAGIGSASLPWITGMVSTHWRSLHVGFSVPLTASALMLIASLTMQRWSEPADTLQA
jgi:fucose permease